MRLQSIELIRYGRFTSRQLHFPRPAPGGRDFHLVVGANEAGKSTLRRAVAELLFGMPLRSEMDFVHPLAELRLGAVIESAAGTLAFHRARGRKPLRSPADEVLADDTLLPHLGATGEALFNRMYCLDLAGLLAGGQSILDASDDLGQLLFQSAAGLGRLGAVRDALADEANRLYAPRKSGDRAFYQALDRLDAARVQLRGLTVNAAQWAAAAADVERLQADRQAAAARYRELAAQQQRLERIRRVAPRVAQWQALQVELQAQAPAALKAESRAEPGVEPDVRTGVAAPADFPPDAAQRLADAELAMARHGATLVLHRAAEERLQREAAALPQDPAVLAEAAAVQALAAQAQACRQHPQKLARAQQDVQRLRGDLAAVAAQLGWPAAEEALRAQAPPAQQLKALAAWLQQRPGLLQACDAASAGLARAQAALARLQREAAADTPLAPESHLAALAAALEESQPVHGTAARQRLLQAAVTQAEAHLQAARQALGAWQPGLNALPDPEALATLTLPSEEQITALKADRATLAAAAAAARQRSEDAADAARQAALALAQFNAQHSVVTAAAVQQARGRRDGIWQGIKAGSDALAAQAPLLDDAIAEADRLVDLQRDHAADAARLAALQRDSVREAAASQARAEQSALAQDALRAFDQRWAQQAQASGLPGLPLLDAAAWLAQRSKVLDAAAALQASRQALQDEQAAAAAAATRLHALLSAWPPPDAPPAGTPATTLAEGGAALGALRLQAEQRLARQQAARASAELLARQRSEAQTEQDHHALALQRAEAAAQAWLARWQAGIAAAGLAAAWADPDQAASALPLAEQVQACLAQLDDLRRHGIQGLQQDLADLVHAARALQPRLAGGASGLAIGRPDDTDRPAALDELAAQASACATQLAQRLQQAHEAQQARDRLLAEAQASAALARAAAADLAAARAVLAPLAQLARSDDPAVLRGCIAASDRRRALLAAVQQQRQAIVEGGDGLPLEALVAECAGLAPEALKTQIDALGEALAGAVDEQSRLATELARAEAAMQRLQGGSAAAAAESMRLEALAQLGDAAERYVTVATAHRLLRWAIDRYRERKQGPLLQRASALFAQLTLGSFDRLAPDFDATPPRLEAVRAGGTRVPVSGLSEGTRDQLFLALRVAALEMQIAADRPLPFIADDLFVNFHDQRSQAGLAVLGDLARHTQVIFLTHHDHLVDVARAALGADLPVIQLD